MKIVFITNEYPPRPHGGIGSFTQIVARGLVGRGHKVTVIGYGPQPGNHDDNGVQVIQLHERSFMFLSGFINRLRLTRFLKKFVKQECVDIVETPEFGGLLPFPIKGCNIIVRLHSSTIVLHNNGLMHSSKIIMYYERLTLSNHKYWIAVSNFILKQTEYFTELKPAKSVIVHNPTLLFQKSGNNKNYSKNRYSYLANGTKHVFPYSDYVLYAGTLVDFKGVYALAESANIIVKSFPTLKFVFVGRDTIKNGISAKNRILDIIHNNNNIIIEEPVEHDTLMEYMRNASMLVFPSRLESFGLVAIEAMSVGCPVIALDIPPMNGYIEHQKTGILIESQSPELIADAVIQLQNDSALRKKISKNAQQYVNEHFSLDSCLDKTISFYKTIIGTQPDRSGC